MKMKTMEKLSGQWGREENANGLSRTSEMKNKEN